MSMGQAGMLHHLELYVRNLERSAEFWAWLLSQFGYREHQRWNSGISWILGPTYIVLVQVDEEHQSPPYHRKRIGLNHLAFHAKDRAQVDTLAAELQQHGAQLLYNSPIEHENGQYALYVEDPDRIKVEIVSCLPSE